MKTRSEVIAEALSEARAGRQVVIVSSSGRQSAEVMGMILGVDLVDAATDIRRGSGRDEIRFPSGGRLLLRSTFASLRGYTFTRVYVDVAEAVGTIHAGTIETFA